MAAILIIWITFILNHCACVCVGEVWRTVFLVQRDTGVNVWSLYNQTSSFHDSLDQVKSLREPHLIAMDGNYRSKMMERWTSVQPKKVRLALFNENGIQLWYMTFNGTGTTLDPSTWFTPSRLLESLDETIMDSKENLKLFFNEDSMDVQNKGGRSWLYTSWIQKESGPEIAFSGRKALDKSKLSSVSYLSNSELVQNGGHIYYTVVGDNLAMCTTVRYLYGIGVGRMPDASKSIDYLRFNFSAVPTCYEGLVPYRNSHGLEKIFRPNYTSGDEEFYPIATTRYYTLQFDYTTGAYKNRIYLFRWTNTQFIPAPILTIQWLADNVVGDRFDELLINEKITSKNRRLYISAGDHRGSVVFFGVVGVFILLLIIVTIVLLDVATLNSHFKYMKFNTKKFRSKAKDGWQKLKKQVNLKSKRRETGQILVTPSLKSGNSGTSEKSRKVMVVNALKKGTRGGGNTKSENTPRNTVSLNNPNIAVTSTSKSLPSSSGIPSSKTNVKRTSMTKARVIQKFSNTKR